MKESTAVGYIKSLTDVMTRIFHTDDQLEAIDLADGNVNLVFRVHTISEPLARSVIVKQALPYARVVGESFPMPLERAGIEASLLQIEGQYCPERVPTLYHYDEVMHICIMQDLNQHIIMRKGLVTQTVYPEFSRHLGTFMAHTLFYTSDLYMAHDKKKEAVARHINPGLCKVTEDLVFTDPYTTNSGNKWNPELTPQVEAIRADDWLRSEMFLLKEEFMTKAEALIHGDLHTGSIMVNQADTKVIDPEFAFYGPMAFDVGSLLANLAISYCSQSYHAQDATVRTAFQSWLLDTIRNTWAIFESEFRQLWATQLNAQWATDAFREKYLARLLRYTAAYGSAEIMRRILGLAHVYDLESIPDLQQRAMSESKALNIAREWLRVYPTLQHIDQLTHLVEATPSSYPY